MAWLYSSGLKSARAAYLKLGNMAVEALEQVHPSDKMKRYKLLRCPAIVMQVQPEQTRTVGSLGWN